MSRRQDWMTDAYMPRDNRAEVQKSANRPGSHSRELNPHWKNGNGGVPTTDSSSEDASTSTSINPWTKMKIKAALEMIEKGEAHLEDVAKERFGSLEEFNALCKLCGYTMTSQNSSAFVRINAPTHKEDGKIEKAREVANEKMRKHVAQRRQREEAVVSNCQFCHNDKVVVVSVAEYTFLARPQNPVNSFHLLIIPRQHEESTLDCGPEVLNEIRNYKKSLIRLYQSHDCEPVFVELRRRVGDKRQHVHIECFGVSTSRSSVDANVYMRTQLKDAESYWAIHKPIIECPDGLSRALPRRPFPFIHIDLWTESFVHIIEDDRRFPASWPRDTVSKICDLEDKELRDFAPFDWTAALNEHDSAK